jgi:hypothetical protein
MKKVSQSTYGIIYGFLEILHLGSVCVCVCVAYEPTEHLFLFMNGLIRVVVLQPDQNPLPAAPSVPFPYHLERLRVERFLIFG